MTSWWHVFEIESIRIYELCHDYKIWYQAENNTDSKSNLPEKTERLFIIV